MVPASTWSENLWDQIHPLNQAPCTQEFTTWSFYRFPYSVSCFFADELPEYQGEENNHTLHPSFDLASLTKPLLGGFAWRNSLDSSDCNAFLSAPLPLLKLQTQVRRSIENHGSSPVIPFLNPDSAQPNPTLSDLINHQSGAKAWFWFQKAQWMNLHNIMDATHPARSRNLFLDHLIQLCLNELGKVNGTTYSDLNYFLLPYFLQLYSNSASADPHCTDFFHNYLNQLNAICDTHFRHVSVTGPLQTHTFISNQPYISVEKDHLPLNEFEFDQKSNASAHDSNQYLLSRWKPPIGSFHAGLVGNVLDCVRAASWINRWNLHHLPQLSPTHTDKQNRFILGLDSYSGPHSTSGAPIQLHQDPNWVLGHLGYTGCSWWTHLNTKKNSHQQSILLTNRTAHRTVMGVSHPPKCLVIQNLDDARFICYLSKTRSEPTEWTKVSPDILKETILTYSNSRVLIHDSKTIRSVPNINKTRQEFHKRCWDLSLSS
jgi:hypothetical protein